MKTHLTLAIAAGFGLALPTATFAQKNKAPAPAAETRKPEAASAPAAEAKASAKTLPMNARVDMMDASAKTFTTKRLKDGVEVKHMVTATTEIKNGDAAAKFEDIKVGDWVGGLRMRKGQNEFEVVKITKFGAKPAKAAKVKDEAKPTGSEAAPKTEKIEAKDATKAEAKKP